MEKNLINESFFWKHLSDTLLEHMGINKKSFYGKLKPIKSVWDTEDIEKVSQDIAKAAYNKTQYIKDSFKKVISEFKK